MGPPGIVRVGRFSCGRMQGCVPTVKVEGILYKHTGVRVSQCVGGSILTCARFWIQELLYKWAELGVLEGCVYSTLE